MKKHLIGAIMLFAAIAFTGCGNNDQKKNEEAKIETGTEAKAEEVVLPNRLLLIVDPQVDFTTGSLATKKGPEAMDYLAKKLEEGAWKNYGWIIITQDAHPTNHCSFVDQGGVFPPHCVQGTEGMEIYPTLKDVLDNLMQNNMNMNIHYMEKGDLADKEEFSIFQNEHSGEKLRRTIEEFEHFEGIDVCGIATDYCVYETVKDLIAFYPAKQVRVVTNCLAAVDDNDTKLADLMKKKGIKGIEF
ncbi:MAG: isochorismatase family protein [Bacteroidales bacterium]|nr:isochorismatase family protein [Bacteroidales bacterium]